MNVASGGRFALIMMIGVMALGVVFVASLVTGFADVSPQIVWSIRAPRVVLTLVVGAGLAVAGGLLQGVFGNPLAAPSIVGVSASGAAGASIGAALGVPFNSIPLAFMGVMIAGVGLIVVRAIASRDGKVNSTALLLGGVAISFFSLALVLLATPFVNREAGRSFSFWANGSFALATWSGVIAVAPLVIVGLVIAFGIASRVDPLSLGSIAARALGVDADRVTQFALVAVVLLVAPGVTVVGIIAFVGLVVPHALRFFLGPRNTFLLPASAVFGALLVASADFISRNMLAPAEIPVGAVTSLVGAPVFLVLLHQMVRRGVVST